MTKISVQERSDFPSFSNLTNDFFENRFYPFKSQLFENMPSANVKETEESITLLMAIPGVDKDKIDIKIENNLLTISCENEVLDENTETDFIRKEYSYNSFKRAFSLPENAQKDNLTARLEKGELVITIPKSKNNLSQVKKIKVS